MNSNPAKRPLYQQAEAALLRLLQGYTAGQQLPPEPALAQSLGVSRATLREALRSLAEQQIVSRRQGLGTFYNGPRPTVEAGLETLVSIETLIRGHGLRCETLGLEIGRGVAGRDARALGLDPQAAVTVVARIQAAEGRPVAYLVDVLPLAVATPEELRQSLSGPVLDYLSAHGRPAPTHAEADVVPLKATLELAGRLEVPPSTALLLLEETVYGQGGVPIDCSRSYLVPGFFQFHLLRRILL